MYCTKCGTENSDTARFCTSCGASTVPGAASDAGAGYAAAGTAARPRKLRRIIAEKKLAGVCAGFAEYFDMDVTLVRLIWLGLVLCPPAPGLIIYLVAWAILPKE